VVGDRPATEQLRLAVLPMELEDVSQVLEVDRESYTLPWPASAYRREILHNRNARYLVLREMTDEDVPTESEEHPRSRLPFPFLRRARSDESRPRILGYAGMWLMVDEAHITTIAIRVDWRGHGLGEVLLASLIESAAAIAAQRITLEVRVSNEVAQALYRKYGFHTKGVRTRYYSDNNEDAYIMTTEGIQTAEFRSRFESLVGQLARRLAAEQGLLVAAPGMVGEVVQGRD
jgi:[ribosomal protein S18]-alanine N-acetyltransferase